MLNRLFRFGGTQCAVTLRPVPRVRPGDVWVATVDVVTERNRRRDPGVSPPMHFRAFSANEALARAALHLERRFGPLREAPPPDGDIPRRRQRGC